MDRLTKSYPGLRLRRAHQRPGRRSGTTCPDSKKELVRNTYWRGDAEAWLNGDTPVMGGGNGALPRVQPDLHRRAADEQEDHAQAQHHAADREQKAYVHHDGAIDPHARIERDGPDGDRPGAGDPDHGDHAPAVRDERRRSRRVLPGLQQLRRRLVQRGAESDLTAPRSCRSRIRSVHGEGDPPRSRARPPVGLIRPIDAQAKYPNAAAPSMMASGGDTTRCSGPSRRPGWCSGCTPSRRPTIRTRWAATTWRLPVSCSPGRASTRRPSRSSTRCRCGWRRCS